MPLLPRLKKRVEPVRDLWTGISAVFVHYSKAIWPRSGEAIFVGHNGVVSRYIFLEEHLITWLSSAMRGAHGRSS
jgi:hypothetical protein